jgi:hypothetical protein
MNLGELIRQLKAIRDTVIDVDDDTPVMVNGDEGSYSARLEGLRLTADPVLGYEGNPIRLDFTLQILVEET